MYFVPLSFGVSLLVTLLMIKSAAKHSWFSADHDLTGPQKFHAQPVPRIGGVAIFVAMLAGALVMQVSAHADADLVWRLLLCAIPAFMVGLWEDLTKRVSPRVRMFFTAVSAGLGIWLLGALIDRTRVPGLDALIAILPFAIAFTVFMVVGISNSINIIDGFNGLASMCAMLMFAAMAYVAFEVGDTFIGTASLLTCGALLGFFLWNYPGGLIFLGDGGAYLIGFLLAELGILLVVRNQGVSPFFPFLLAAYPIVETVFSIYRRRLRGASPGDPDGIHLHSLIYRRLVRWEPSASPRRRTVRNSMTAPYLWVICLFSVIPALLNWNNTTALAICFFLFVFAYINFYGRIVRFKSPRWLVLKG